MHHSFSKIIVIFTSSSLQYRTLLTNTFCILRLERYSQSSVYFHFLCAIHLHPQTQEKNNRIPAVYLHHFRWARSFASRILHTRLCTHFRCELKASLKIFALVEISWAEIKFANDEINARATSRCDNSPNLFVGRRIFAFFLLST